MELRFGDDGLIVAVIQDRLTGQVRMVGHMNREALAATLKSGRVTFFSRSRGKLWEKGESSGNQLLVRSLHADCDADALLVLVDPVGPTCHTGSPSCFFRRVDAEGRARVLEPGAHDLDTLLPGEILVSRTTDVGLSPLFLVAAGVGTGFFRRVDLADAAEASDAHGDGVMPGVLLGALVWVLFAQRNDSAQRLRVIPVALGL